MLIVTIILKLFKTKKRYIIIIISQGNKHTIFVILLMQSTLIRCLFAHTRQTGSATTTANSNPITIDIPDFFWMQTMKKILIHTT